jgi:hypothetical protein
MKITWNKRAAGCYSDSSGRFAIELQITSPDPPVMVEWCIFDKDDKSSHWPDHPICTADRLRKAKQLVDGIIDAENYNDD